MEKDSSGDGVSPFVSDNSLNVAGNEFKAG